MAPHDAIDVRPAGATAHHAHLADQLGATAVPEEPATPEAAPAGNGHAKLVLAAMVRQESPEEAAEHAHGWRGSLAKVLASEPFQLGMMLLLMVRVRRVAFGAARERPRWQPGRAYGPNPSCPRPAPAPTPTPAPTP